MSISALSSNLIADLSQQRQNPFQEIKQDFQQLASALQSGDLSGAQSAYSNIQQLLGANSGSSASTTSSNGPSTLQNDFAALGQALQSGDLSTAQSAFSQLQSDFQAARQSGGAGASVQSQDQYVPSRSQGQNPFQEAWQDYKQIGQDLQSGDLTDAQTAYSNLQQLVQAYPGSSSTSSSTPTTVQTDFATLGQDLQAGNLTSSQSAFSKLQSDIAAALQPATGSSTTAATPAVSTSTPTPSPIQQVQQDYLQLASALQSGSLTGAQSAFAALEQALQTQGGTSTAPATTTSTNSNDPIANDLNALGQALSSGNLTQAQSAFTQLNQDIQTAEKSGQAQNSQQSYRAEEHHHHHHHGGDGGSSSQSSSSSSASNSYTSSNSSSTVNVYA
jgi:DNA-binding FadR family transcriptional regulator